MNRKLRNGIIAVAALALILAWALWFFSPGVHTFLFWTRVDKTGSCYLFDPDSGEAVGESYCQIKGVASPLFKDFDGSVHVQAYPHEGKTVDNYGNAWRENGDIRIFLTDVFYGEEYVVTQAGKQIPDRDLEYHIYSVWLTGEGKEDILVWDEEEDTVFVLADSIQEAETILDRWMN